MEQAPLSVVEHSFTTNVAEEVQRLLQQREALCLQIAPLQDAIGKVDAQLCGLQAYLTPSKFLGRKNPLVKRICAVLESSPFGLTATVIMRQLNESGGATETAAAVAQCLWRHVELFDKASRGIYVLRASCNGLPPNKAEA